MENLKYDDPVLMELIELEAERIENTSSDIKMIDELENNENEEEEIDMEIEDDIDIEIDINDENADGNTVTTIKTNKSEEKEIKTDYSSIIKEAKVFISYSLFNKAKDRLKSVENWHFKPEILELMIEIYIEENKNEKAVDLMFKLLDLYIESKEQEKSLTLLNDIKEFVPEDGRIISFEMKIKNIETNNANIQEKDYKENSSPKQDSSLNLETETNIDINISNQENNIEPPQNKLDELAFFIEIQDFKSASLLLQDLIIQYPESKLLSDYNNTMPANEQNFAETMNDVKKTISDTMNLGDKNAEDFYDMAIVHSSMGMQTESLNYMKKACEIEPENKKFLTAYAQLAEDFKQYQEAIKSLQNLLKIIEKDSERKEILEKLSNLYYHLGDEKKRQQIDAEIELLKI
jgi:tetratricopeptide (TPR) repeat protein